MSILAKKRNHDSNHRARGLRKRVRRYHSAVRVELFQFLDPVDDDVQLLLRTIVGALAANHEKSGFHLEIYRSYGRRY